MTAPSGPGYRNTSSPYGGKAKGRWPFQVDQTTSPASISATPCPGADQGLVWEHAPSLTMPFSEDALQFARRLAATKYTYPDERHARR